MTSANLNPIAGLQNLFQFAPSQSVTTRRKAKEIMISKAVNDFTQSEQRQLINMIYRYYPGASAAYIADRVFNDLGYEVLLIKEGDEVLAASYYFSTNMKTPFAKKELPVFHFGQTIKKAGYRGNVIQKTGLRFFPGKLGPFFLFKKVVATAILNSPKAYENFIFRFQNHFIGTKETGCEISKFILDFHNLKRGASIKVDEHFTSYDSNLEVVDITEDWERYYKAKNPEINALFEEKGIIEFKNGRIFKVPKPVLVCGFRKGLSG